MSSFPPTGIDYYGSKLVELEDPGEVTVAKNGIASCVAVFRVPAANWSILPGRGSVHPIFRTIQAITMTIALKGPFAYGTLQYEGSDPTGGGGQDGEEAVYELVRGVSEDKIETHKDFDSLIGGTATAPLNGAIFRDVKTGVSTSKSQDSNENKVFDKFELSSKYKGVESYLNASQMTWRKSWVTHANPTSATRAGKIGTPEGQAPAINGTWLNMGLTSTKRGSVYQVTEEWRASGKDGWDAIIYPTGG